MGVAAVGAGTLCALAMSAKRSRAARRSKFQSWSFLGY